MKKMTLLSLGIISFSALTLGAPAAFADTTTPEAESEATVLFSANDDGEEVVEPPVEGGGEGGVVDPEGSDGNNGDGNASFNIAWVSNFRFNEKNDLGQDVPIKLNGNGMQLWAKGTKLTLKHKDAADSVYENIPNFIQVVDNRGKLSGWNVSVSASNFTGKDENDVVSTLNGAVLSLNQPVLSGPEGVAAPSAFANKLELGADAATLMSADAALKAGTGSWTMKFGEEEQTSVAYKTLVGGTGVKLDIPAKAQPKAGVPYKSTLTWILSDGPAS